MFLLPVEPDPAAVQHPGGAGRVAHLLLAGGGASSQHQQEEAEGGQEVPLPPLQRGNPGADSVGRVAHLPPALHLPEGEIKIVAGDFLKFIYSLRMCRQ